MHQVRHLPTGLSQPRRGVGLVMATLTINGHPVAVADGETILDTARELGIDIPTMCYLSGLEKHTSCMICVVHDLNSDKLIPACSAPVVDGMEIETDSDLVRQARKDTLDLLLSEHVGDCEAPCHRICPALMNIPLMIRQIRAGEFREAIVTVKQDIALPAVLGRICPAPCEKGCNRNHYDEAVSICMLKRFAADVDLAGKVPYRPAMKDKSGYKVAIVGAGPAGLAAAYYLQQDGHICHLFDRNSEPGGMLRYGVPDDRLSREVLNTEIELISDLGAGFFMNKILAKHFSLKELRKDYDAVILAPGILKEDFNAQGLHLTSRGIAVDRKTFATNLEGVFAGGSAVSPSQMAVRAVGHGKTMAISVDQLLRGKAITGRLQRFNSVMGRLQEGETTEFIREAETYKQIASTGDGYSEQEAIGESRRCFHCDCRRPDTCKLRRYAEEYGAEQLRYKTSRRKRFSKNVQHDLVIYESGKCIKCGLCVQITEKAREEFGFTFVNRGFDVRVEVPFNESLARGLAKVSEECADACPTAAISMRDI